MNFAHLEAAELALSTGKHVWCEKPRRPRSPTPRPASAGRSGQGAGSQDHSGLQLLKSPTLLAIKKLTKDGVIGDIVHFNGVYTEDFMCDMDMPIRGG